MTTVEESCMPYKYKPYCFKNNKLNHEIKKEKKILIPSQFVCPV